MLAVGWMIVVVTVHIKQSVKYHFKIRKFWWEVFKSPSLEKLYYASGVAHAKQLKFLIGKGILRVVLVEKRKKLYYIADDIIQQK